MGRSESERPTTVFRSAAATLVRVRASPPAAYGVTAGHPASSWACRPAAACRAGRSTWLGDEALGFAGSLALAFGFVSAFVLGLRLLLGLGDLLGLAFVAGLTSSLACRGLRPVLRGLARLRSDLGPHGRSGSGSFAWPGGASTSDGHGGFTFVGWCPAGSTAADASVGGRWRRSDRGFRGGPPVVQSAPAVGAGGSVAGRFGSGCLRLAGRPGPAATTVGSATRRGRRGRRRRRSRGWRRRGGASDPGGTEAGGCVGTGVGDASGHQRGGGATGEAADVGSRACGRLIHRRRDRGAEREGQDDQSEIDAAQRNARAGGGASATERHLPGSRLPLDVGNQPTSDVAGLPPRARDRPVSRSMRPPPIGCSGPGRAPEVAPEQHDPFGPEPGRTSCRAASTSARAAAVAAASYGAASVRATRQVRRGTAVSGRASPPPPAVGRARRPAPWSSARPPRSPATAPGAA